MKRQQHALIMTGYNFMTRTSNPSSFYSRSFGVIYYIFLHFKLHISHDLLQQLGYIA